VRAGYELFTSELVIVEASAGDPAAAERRLKALDGIAELPIDHEVQKFAGELILKGGVPVGAEADALHIAVAAVHRMDYLLTWNFRHIDNAATKPVIRSICVDAGYAYPEICAPVELFPEGD
jgi:predicted nucleic acid-binding protein